MIKHTPGPWTYGGQEFNDVRESDGELVAVALHLRVKKPERSIAEAKANARLIAAAPDLLEALKAIVKSLADQDDEGMIEHAQQMIDARAAIAKATGGNNV